MQSPRAFIGRHGMAYALVAALLFVGGGAAAWRFGRTVEVIVVTATTGRIAARVVGPGSVQARVPVTLAARVSATIAQVHVDVGDVVQAGQLLVTLDDRDLTARRGVVGGQQEALLRNTEGARATLAKSQADLDLARAKLRRDAELLAQGFVSPAVVDASNAAHDGALAGVAAARAGLAAREAGARTLAQVRDAASVLSRRWGVLSELQPSDFADALGAADAAG